MRGAGRQQRIVGKRARRAEPEPVALLVRGAEREAPRAAAADDEDAGLRAVDLDQLGERAHLVQRNGVAGEARLDAAFQADDAEGPRLNDVFQTFLRELRPFWAKADPDPLPAVGKLAKRLSIDLGRYNRKSLVFARVEAGLIRRRRELAATQSSTHRRAAH